MEHRSQHGGIERFGMQSRPGLIEHGLGFETAVIRGQSLALQGQTQNPAIGFGQPVGKPGHQLCRIRRRSRVKPQMGADNGDHDYIES